MFIKDFKKSAWAKCSNNAYFHTSTHPAQTGRDCPIVCYKNLQKNGNWKGVSEAVSWFDKHFVWSILKPW